MDALELKEILKSIDDFYEWLMDLDDQDESIHINVLREQFDNHFCKYL